MVAKFQYSSVCSKMALVVAVAIVALLFTTAAGEAVAVAAAHTQRPAGVGKECARLEYPSPDCNKKCRDDGYHGGFVKNYLCCCLNAAATTN